MPLYRHRTILHLARGLRAFVALEMGFTREQIPARRDPAPAENRPAAPLSRELEELRRKLEQAEQDRESLRAALAARQARNEESGTTPANVVWIFTGARSGSTWLGRMLADIFEGGALRDEPLAGELFGFFYEVRSRAWHKKEWEPYLFNDKYEQTWLRSIRNTVLDGANARFSNAKAPLVIKEPNGALGVSLLSRAMPESGFVLLVRDPRDVIASLLDFNRKGGHLDTVSTEGSLANVQAEGDPDAFVQNVARFHLQNMERVRAAHHAHRGPKALVRYEDLARETEASLAGVISALGLSADAQAIAKAVEKHSWKEIPEKDKGEGKFYRKATPGEWREDLTPEQITIIERTTAPLLEEFYNGTF